MKVIKNKRSGYTVSLEIEESFETLEAAMNAAFKKVSRHARLAGFRKGKIPRAIFEKHYGKGIIIEEAMSAVVNSAYGDAINELDLKVVDYPKNVNVGEYEDHKPVRFTCNVDVEPIVKLGKYKGIKVKRESTDVRDDDVKAAIDKMLEEFADFKIVQRGAKSGDILRFNLSAKMNGNPYELWSQDNVGLRVGHGHYGQAFDDAVEGIEPGQQKSFTLSYPSDFDNQDVAGNSLDFELTLHEVREKELPELTDAMAKKLHKDCETVTALNDLVRTELAQQKEKESTEKLKQNVLRAVIDNAKVELPNVMVEHQIDHAITLLESRLKESDITISKYLDATNRTPEALRDNFRESSTTRVKSKLVLSAIREKEGIEASEDDLTKEISSWTLGKVKTLEDLKKHTDVNIDTVAAVVVEEKVEQLLISMAKIS